MQYLVTDPCYVWPKDKWDKFVDDYYGEWDREMPEEGVSIPGLGKMIACANTANGDGMTTVTDYRGNKQFIGVDAGLVAIFEVSNVYKNKKNSFMALCRDKEEAFDWWEQALRI